MRLLVRDSYVPLVCVRVCAGVKHTEFLTHRPSMELFLKIMLKDDPIKRVERKK